MPGAYGVPDAAPNDGAAVGWVGPDGLGAYGDGAPDDGPLCEPACGDGAPDDGRFVVAAGFRSFVDGAGAYGDGAAAAGFGAYGEGGFVSGGCAGRRAGRWLAVGGGRGERRAGSGTPASVVGGAGPSSGLPEGGSPPSDDMRAS